MPDVSFIVTFYNKSLFIPQVLNAIFSQANIGEGEYIFVDDGSTDDTLQQLRKICESKENVHIITQENTGPALATNRGIKAATAPYLKFCDGDDILHPRATEIMIQALQKSKAGLAICQAQETTIGSPLMDAPDTPLIEDEAVIIENPLEDVLRRVLGNPSCWLASKDAVNKASGCDPRVFIQDISFLLRMSQHTSFIMLPQTLMWWPVDIENRISYQGNGAQILHDLNLAYANFITEFPTIPDKLQTLALRRAAGRSWKWARRMGGENMLSKYYLRYIRAILFPGIGDKSGQITATCDAFHLTNYQTKIRLI